MERVKKKKKKKEDRNRMSQFRTYTVGEQNCQSLKVLYYYPGQKNRYSREIHEVDLQFDHVREHLISSQFFSKRNTFRNGGRGVALVSDGKSQIAHFPQKRKIDFEDTFEVRIERKCPALSLLKPRYSGRSTSRGDRP